MSCSTRVSLRLIYFPAFINEQPSNCSSSQLVSHPLGRIFLSSELCETAWTAIEKSIDGTACFVRFSILVYTFIIGVTRNCNPKGSWKIFIALSALYTSVYFTASKLACRDVPVVQFAKHLGLITIQATEVKTMKTSANYSNLWALPTVFFQTYHAFFILVSQPCLIGSAFCSAELLKSVFSPE